MSIAGQVRMKAVEESQQRIIDTIKKLEDEDQIAINRGGAEDAFV
jgi:flagellar motor switch protein FliG